MKSQDFFLRLLDFSVVLWYNSVRKFERKDKIMSISSLVEEFCEMNDFTFLDFDSSVGVRFDIEDASVKDMFEEFIRERFEWLDEDEKEEIDSTADEILDSAYFDDDPTGSIDMVMFVPLW